MAACPCLRGFLPHAVTVAQVSSEATYATVEMEEAKNTKPLAHSQPAPLAPVVWSRV